VEREMFSVSLFNENINGIEKLKIKKFNLLNLNYEKMLKYFERYDVLDLDDDELNFIQSKISI
jgi:hypothetical protein